MKIINFHLLIYQLMIFFGKIRKPFYLLYNYNLLVKYLLLNIIAI